MYLKAYEQYRKTSPEKVLEKFGKIPGTIQKKSWRSLETVPENSVYMHVNNFKKQHTNSLKLKGLEMHSNGFKKAIKGLERPSKGNTDM